MINTDQVRGEGRKTGVSQAKHADDVMEIKVNMECALRILEKNGFNVEGKAVAGSTVNGSKELNSSSADKIELFQVRCSPPYIRFEATIDQQTQQNVLDSLNHGLEGLLKTAEKKQTP